jgi:uncharacterized protein (DUF427 family)
VTVRAIWKDTVLAESDDTIVVEGNHYFPADAVRRDHLVTSQSRTHCPWKGDASYYSVDVDGSRNQDAAWYYPEPYPAAEVIRDRVAFWRGVQVTSDADGGRPGPTPRRS